MTNRIELHKIRIDVLLWLLGGFAEPDRSLQRGYGWDEDQRRVLIEQVRRIGAEVKLRDDGQVWRGTWTGLCRMFGKERHAVCSEIYRLRRQGRLPPSSRAAA